jgi:micrococcal nuclease
MAQGLSYFAVRQPIFIGKENNMRYKIIAYTLFLLFALGLIGIASIVSAQARPASTYTAHVVRIIDGDTIHVRDITGEKHRIRLAMIDAPESEQPFGTEATKKISELLRQGTVRLKVKCIDKYNREVAFVYCEGKDVSAEMLKDGMALHYHMNFDKCDIYDKFEAAAKRCHKGLWSQEKVEKPWNYRQNLAKRRQSNVHKDLFQA